MVNAFDVAGALINLQHEQSREIDKLQLQKLLYLVQGTHMVLWGRPAFREELTAYENGPVVVTVEKSYREAFPDSNIITHPIPQSYRPLPSETQEIVGLVLSHFGEWPGPRLEGLTKESGSPWMQVWKGSPSRWRPRASTIRKPLVDKWFGSHPVVPQDAPTRAESTADAFARLGRGEISPS